MIDPYPVRVLEAVDQLGNALSGGSPRHTVSARTGNWASEGKFWWRMLELVIDCAMYPWQLHWHHCYYSYVDEVKRAPGYCFKEGSVAGVLLVSIFILLAAPIIGLAGLPRYLVKRLHK